MKLRPGFKLPAPAVLGVIVAAALILVFGTMAAGIGQTSQSRPLDAFAVVLLALSAVTTFATRRDGPVWALGATTVVVNTYLLLGYPFGPVQLCLILVTYQVARQRPLRISVPACLLAAVIASVTIAVRLSHGRFDSSGLLALLWTAWIVLPWSVGALLHVTSVARERTRQELVSRVALEERMKIASEVHDVAGHGFAVVAMQAGVALLVFDEQPDQARKSLEAIQAISTKSLTDLRGMLDTFHPASAGATVPFVRLPSSDEDSADAEGLAGLAGLVDRMRAGGLSVELELAPVEPVPERDVASTAYRVVRESLTNVLRHAGPTTAQVCVGRVGDRLVVRVRDHGVGAGHGGAVEGRGLVGMRTRVEAVGGSFTAGTVVDGGFHVMAELPLPKGAR
ncbi:MAG TPA: histidine kinase [Pseudonocardiaceae bacterium]|jgi:signal transduction histidine kinase|nr:histidine kinase [Pseudonocardiaceae bacterium]